mmetsp:Transcript_11935/g.30175  ORF Transcript_11935/g.30175 Transcript_11935/m.30175 type:complete len:225 (+) Transcript_11935:205-879(+)
MLDPHRTQPRIVCISTRGDPSTWTRWTLRPPKCRGGVLFAAAWHAGVCLRHAGSRTQPRATRSCGFLDRTSHSARSLPPVRPPGLRDRPTAAACALRQQSRRCRVHRVHATLCGRHHRRRGSSSERMCLGGERTGPLHAGSWLDGQGCGSSPLGAHAALPDRRGPRLYPPHQRSIEAARERPRPTGALSGHPGALQRLVGDPALRVQSCRSYPCALPHDAGCCR